MITHVKHNSLKLESMINGQMIAGFIIHVFLNFCMFFHPELPEMGIVMLPFTLANLVGFVLISLRKPIAGAKVFMISSFFYIPIGLIGAFGAKKLLDERNREQFISNNLNA